MNVAEKIWTASFAVPAAVDAEEAVLRVVFEGISEFEVVAEKY